MNAKDSQANLQKPALVFVHGYLGGSQQWNDQVEAFSDYFNVITPDLPGYGLNYYSQSPDSVAGFADYVLAELDKQGINDFDLVGHSMGGMIVQEIIAMAPARVKKLVLYGTGSVGILPGRFESIEVSKKRLRDEGVAATARRISATWFANGENCCDYKACADIAVMASLQAAEAGLTAMAGWSGEDNLTKIKSPTLIMWGDQDLSYQWALPEKLWREIPGANLAVLPGCSHAVHLEEPKLFNEILLGFLTKKLAV